MEFSSFTVKKKKAIRYGTETVTYKAAQLWELLPYDIKNSSTLIEFKERIKTRSPDNCPCRFCKTYLKDIGYIDIKNIGYIDITNAFSST